MKRTIYHKVRSGAATLLPLYLFALLPLYLFALLPLLAACTDDDYPVYDTSQKDAVFFDYKNADAKADTTVDYNFNYDIAQEHVVSLPIELMGMPADRDRTITLEAVADSTDMREGVHYTIYPVTLPAHAITTTANVHLLRGNDPELLTRSFRLRLAIVENDDLRPTGQRTFTITYSDIRPTVRPAWWSTYSPLPVYSYEAAQLFFKYFYDLAPKANEAVYEEIIKAYGDYFVNAKASRGPMAMYDNFLIKYVLIPMYNDTKDTMEWQSVPSVN